MAEISRFFNSVNGDRRYLAEEFASFFAKFLSNGVYSGEELTGTLEVRKNGDLSIGVDEGAALIRGYEYENTTVRAHTLEKGGTYDRIDRIVVRLDRTMDERNILTKVIKGVPSTSPVAPELIRNNEIYDISLAQILVKKNITAIDASDITDERYDESVCGFVSSIISIPTDRLEQEWDEWMYEIQENTFAHAVDEQTGLVYRLVISDGELYLEEV